MIAAKSSLEGRMERATVMMISVSNHQTGGNQATRERSDSRFLSQCRSRNGIMTLRPVARAPDDSKAEERIAAFYHRLAIPALAVAVALGCVAVVSADWNSWVSGAANQSTDDAVVSADVSTLSAQVSGTIRTIATQ